MRAQLVAQLEELIAGSDTLPVMKRGELSGKISTKPGLNRYLRVTGSNAVDDTLFKRSGKKVFGAAWHHDGAAKGPQPRGECPLFTRTAT